MTGRESIQPCGSDDCDQIFLQSESGAISTDSPATITDCGMPDDCDHGRGSATIGELVTVMALLAAMSLLWLVIGAIIAPAPGTVTGTPAPSPGRAPVIAVSAP